MTILVTGSSGHLGEALMRMARQRGLSARGLDAQPGRFTALEGSIVDPGFVQEAMRGIRIVFHSATLHKPHVATHARQDFIDVNVTGTLNLLEAARAEGVEAFVFTSTTSAFGAALRPPEGAPAAWIDERVQGPPKNIYGATKTSAETLCELAARKDALPTIVLRTSRFFPEDDDNKATRDAYSSDNAKLNEFVYRRGDIEDMADAHFCAADRARSIGYGKYIVSATTPFTREDAPGLRDDAPTVLRSYAAYDKIYEALGWRMFPSLDRVYDNAKARAALGWRPKWDFASMLARVAEGKPPASDLALAVGSKGYHEEIFEDGPFPVDD